MLKTDIMNELRYLKGGSLKRAIALSSIYIHNARLLYTNIALCRTYNLLREFRNDHTGFETQRDANNILKTCKEHGLNEKRSFRVVIEPSNKSVWVLDFKGKMFPVKFFPINKIKRFYNKINVHRFNTYYHLYDIVKFNKLCLSLNIPLF